MNKTNQIISIRWGCLITGVAAMLFEGVLFARSTIKSPLGNEFGWKLNRGIK